MDILILSPTLPLPIDNGAKRRIDAFARILAKNHEVVMISMKMKDLSINEVDIDSLPWDNHYVDIEYKKKLSILRSAFSFSSYREEKFKSKNYQRVLDQILNQRDFDLFLVNFLNMSSYVEKYLTNYSIEEKRPLFILDTHNADHLYWDSFLRQESQIHLKIFAMIEYFKAKLKQNKYLKIYDVVLSVSEEDLVSLKKFSDKPRYLLAPNGVNTKHFSSLEAGPYHKRFVEKQNIVFGGSMDVTMNQDAVEWFIDQIFQNILDEYPETVLWIVGSNPTSNVKKYDGHTNINVTGFVSDIRDYYSKSDVFIIPMRFGGGTKLKTLEAMAMGLPIVSTNVGVQGINVQNGRHLFIADKPEGFANRVIELMKNKKKSSLMGNRARDLIKEKYSWASIVRKTERQLVDLVRQSVN